MKKETVNTFTEGMVKDLHPLNTPATVLTDALNATLVTYDGNEYVLQNDSGNGRVETARLPQGYVPVGMKEYGGIIYVASYNPLNGKSQLGSFPSPERQIGTEELGRSFSVGTNINTSNAYVRLDIYDENKKDLYKLNPGDKFIISSSGISSYLNGYEGELEVHIGIVDKENNITYIEEDLKKPYISEVSGDDWQVFTSKTSGHLAIIIELLTIDTFNLTKDISLKNLNEGESKDLSNPEFSVLFNGSYTTSSNIKANQFKLTSNLGGTYYSTTGIPLQLGLEDLHKKDILEYVVTPICKYGDLSSFAVSGKIDFSILGTGYNKLSEWRYYSDRDYLKLNWGLDYDPLKFVKVSSVDFYFYDFKNNLSPIEFEGPDGKIIKHYKCGSKDSYNGNFSEKIPYKNARTIHGLDRGNLYFTVIKVNFISQSKKEIPPKEYYRLVYTTGIFNEDFVKYLHKDFSELTLNVPINLKFNVDIDNTTLTPQIIPSDSVSLDNPFIGMSSLYGIEGNMDIEYGIESDNYFGNLEATTIMNGDDTDVSGYGLVATLPNTFKSYTTSDSPSYLGTTTNSSNILEDELKKKYDPQSKDTNPRGIVDLDSVKFKKNGNNSCKFSFGGSLRRGLYVSGTKTVTNTNDCYRLIPAVSNLADLNEYVSSAFQGTANNLSSSDRNHLELSGNVAMVTSDANFYVANFSYRRENSLPVTPGDGNKNKNNLTKLGPINPNTAFDSDKLNNYNSAGLKHPITFMIPDGDHRRGKIGREIFHTYNPKFQGVIHDSEDKSWGYIDDYIAVAWKISEYSYVFINMGGVLAWNNSGEGNSVHPTKGTYDPIPKGQKLNKQGCTLEYPRDIGSNNNKALTILDVLYNYLSRVYIPQWGPSTIQTTVPDLDSIVYHGQFDNTFEVFGEYSVKVNKDKLFSFPTAGNKKEYLNYDSVATYIESKLPYKRDKFGKDIQSNLTIETNLKESFNADFGIKYSIGKGINLTELYTKLVNMAGEGFTPSRNKVYIKDSTSTLDGDNKELQMNNVYIIKNQKFVKYDGKVDYGNGEYSNTSPDFLAIKRPTDYKKNAILYIKPGVLGKKLELVEGNNETLLNLDTSNIIYPGCNMFSY